MLLIRYALRNVFRHRSRSIVTFSAIAFGCFAIIFSSGFFQDIYGKLEDTAVHLYSGHLQVAKKGYFDAAVDQAADRVITDVDSLMKSFSKIEGVQLVSPRLFANGLLSDGENSVACFVEGIVPGQEAVTRSADVKALKRSDIVKAGLILMSGNNIERSGDVLVGRGLAKSLEAKQDGELVLLTRTLDDSVNGMDVRIKGIFSASVEEIDDYGIRMPLESVQSLLRTEGAHLLVIKLKSSQFLASAHRSIQEQIRERDDLEIRTWEEVNDFSVKTKLLFQRWFFVLKLIIALVMFLSIYNTMTMSVMERTAEIGTLRAMGAKRGEIVGLFLLEGFFVGLAGGAIGVAAGSLLTLLISTKGIYMPPTPGATLPWMSQPLLMGSAILFSWGLSVFSSVLSAYIPARGASRLDVADALRSVS